MKLKDVKITKNFNALMEDLRENFTTRDSPPKQRISVLFSLLRMELPDPKILELTRDLLERNFFTELQ